MSAIATPPTWRTVIEAWRDIRRDQIVTFLLFGVAIFLYQSGGNLRMMLLHPEFGNRPYLLAISMLRDVLGALALLACVAVAERLGERRTRQAAYLGAIVVAAAIAAPLWMIPRAATYLLGAPGTAGASADERLQDLVGALFSGFFQWLILGGAITFIYVDYHRARAARERLHAAELERSRAARRTLESRLQAMQARVEPQFLFNTLQQVHDLYRDDAARGERMLTELIAYLRAAMPRMRDTSSSVGQEIELARAYLAIVEVRLGDRLRLAIDPPAADARMPPMTLLPLIDRAILRLSASGEGGAIGIRCRIADRRIRLVVADTAAAFLPRDDDADIAGIRERLAALYGNAASLELHRLEGLASEAVVEIPLQGTMEP